MLLILGNTACRQACPLIYDPYCGNDGKTYSNLCALEIAQCENHSIALRHKGKCKVMSMQCRTKLISLNLVFLQNKKLTKRKINLRCYIKILYEGKPFIKNLNTTFNFNSKVYLGLSETLQELLCEHSRNIFAKNLDHRFWKGSKYSSFEPPFLILNIAFRSLKEGNEGLMEALWRSKDLCKDLRQRSL